MEGEIVNRVANSKLVTIDLEDYYPKGERVLLDIKDWLYEGFLLREKDFRESVRTYDWSQYQDKYVALHCSSDAIIPSWAYLLLMTQLSPFAKKVVVGDLKLLETVIFQEIICQLEVHQYQNLPVIIKGCSNKPIPETSYLSLIAKLQPVVKSIMYGEACSTVPLYKKSKKV
ncbi:DUF2480 family protein [Mesonia sp. K7]|uniref:DUF2480 family protein n=1 Tax=Mesonia sp. K7 TaxID=2218606 RepID=UPI000DAA3BD0|nr:DUF2480 family protein [Mesonia sp. K7]PZD78433.1 hypothetical protein DNG35_05060 [Mesonia sp. K7]